MSPSSSGVDDRLSSRHAYFRARAADFRALALSATPTEYRSKFSEIAEMYDSFAHQEEGCAATR
jgi:hypothetical protein